LDMRIVYKYYPLSNNHVVLGGNQA
jgi:hypothetical protein